MAYRFPAQSGTYTTFPATAGVADTSPTVVNAHFWVRFPTLSTVSLFSDGWDRVLRMSPPAEIHWAPPGAAHAAVPANITADAIARMPIIVVLRPIAAPPASVGSAFAAPEMVNVRGRRFDARTSCGTLG